MGPHREGDWLCLVTKVLVHTWRDKWPRTDCRSVPMGPHLSLDGKALRVSIPCSARLSSLKAGSPSSFCQLQPGLAYPQPRADLGPSKVSVLTVWPMKKAKSSLQGTSSRRSTLMASEEVTDGYLVTLSGTRLCDLYLKFYTSIHGVLSS